MISVHTVLRVMYFFVPAYLANMSPVLVGRRFNALSITIDGGRTLSGKRILGDHKTWRGLLAATIAGTLVFEMQRLTYVAGLARGLALIDYAAQPLLLGLLMGICTGVGDAAKSFFKRRIDIAPGAIWPVLDQLDFLFGAYLFVSVVYVPPLLPTLLSLPIIFVGNVAITAIGYYLGLKETWI